MKKELLVELIGLLADGKVEQKEASNQEVPFEIGKSYFIRTVTYHLTGRVVKIVGNFLVLEEGAWIADSGRFNEMIKNGKPSEVEPLEDIIINMSSITDAFQWKHLLPREVK